MRGLRSNIAERKAPESPPRGHWEAHISNFYPGPVRPGFPELRGSSSRGTSSRKLSSGRSRAHTSPVKVQQRGPVRYSESQYLQVDDVLDDGRAVEHAEHVLHRLHRHAVDRFARGAGHVRRGDHVVEREQRVVGIGRLAVEHVEAGGRNNTRREGRVQILLVDDAAARGSAKSRSATGSQPAARIASDFTYGS